MALSYSFISQLDSTKRKKIGELIQSKNKENIPEQIKENENEWIQKEIEARKKISNELIHPSTEEPSISNEIEGYVGHSSMVIIIVLSVVLALSCIGNILFCKMIYDKNRLDTEENKSSKEKKKEEQLKRRLSREIIAAARSRVQFNPREEEVQGLLNESD